MAEASLELVRRAQNGDVNALTGLYKQHHESIFKYVRSRVQDTQAAEDLTGEVFIRMVEKLPAYRITGAPFRAWLFQVARNLVYEHYRKGKRFANVSLHQVENRLMAGDNPAALVADQLKLERVLQALEQLKPTQQEVIRLRFLAGLPIKEVAAILNKTDAAVKALQHRGLTALRIELSKG